MDTSIITGDRKLSVEKWARKSGMNSEFANSLAKAVGEPEETPYMLEKMINSFSKLKKSDKKEVRNALLRVQIYCSINTNSDPIKVGKQLFIAQILEKMWFGSNLLLCEEIELEEHPSKKKGRKK
jgi:hypothetical protein